MCFSLETRPWGVRRDAAFHSTYLLCTQKCQPNVLKSARSHRSGILRVLAVPAWNHILTSERERVFFSLMLHRRPQCPRTTIFGICTPKTQWDRDQPDHRSLRPRTPHLPRPEISSSRQTCLEPKTPFGTASGPRPEDQLDLSHLKSGKLLEAVSGSTGSRILTGDGRPTSSILPRSRSEPSSVPIHALIFDS
jgi:hypothetical protein